MMMLKLNQNSFQSSSPAMYLFPPFYKLQTLRRVRALTAYARVPWNNVFFVSDDEGVGSRCALEIKCRNFPSANHDFLRQLLNVHFGRDKATLLVFVGQPVGPFFGQISTLAEDLLSIPCLVGEKKQKTNRFRGLQRWRWPQQWRQLAKWGHVT